MKILLVHQSFPGQFERFIRHNANNYDIYGIGMANYQEKKYIKEYWRYSVDRGTTTQAHPASHEVETKVIRAEACYKLLKTKKDNGFQPDVVIAHPGWGESIYIKQLWPSTILITYQEFFYSLYGSDLDYDTEYRAVDDLVLMRLELKNSMILHSLNISDACICPTYWQQSRFPKQYLDKINVIHEGIDFSKLDKAIESKLPNPNLTKWLNSSKYITYMARTLEPYRGYHKFLQATEKLLTIDKDLHICIIGNDKGPGYGSNPPDSYSTWKEYFLQTYPISQHERIHYLGPVDYNTFVHVIKNSLCHIYISFPFVLSWSVLETMYLGVPIVANNIPMTQEFIKHNNTGLLYDYFDTDDLCHKVQSIVDDHSLSQSIADNSKNYILQYSSSQQIHKYNQLIKSLLKTRQS